MAWHDVDQEVAILCLVFIIAGLAIFTAMLNQILTVQ